MGWVSRVRFEVPGIPRPGGSKTAFYNKKLGRAMVVDAGGEKVKDWKSCVKHAAFAAMKGRGLIPGAVKLCLVFRLPRPKSHYGSGKNASVLKASAPRWPTTKPDRTKLMRSTEDALKGIVWRDDSQVVGGEPWKVYGIPGCVVEVFEWKEDEAGLFAGSTGAAVGGA